MTAAAPDDERAADVRLSGWGTTMPSVGRLVVQSSDDRDSLAATVKALPARGGIARGLGRSYGDPAQRGGGVAVQLRDAAPHVVIDAESATATVPAGVSLDELLALLVPRGLFVPVSPGTRFVTVGGAIACDIHGKNHHLEGSFGNHVRRLSLLLADGTVVELSPAQRPELFWATIGGMGLTGIILEATIGLLRIETSRCSVDTDRAPDLQALLTLMEEGDRFFRYSVAWIDLMAKGAHLGRSVLTRGDHARVDELAPRQAVDPLVYDARQRLTVPPVVPGPGLVNHVTIKAFNEMWFRKAPRRRVGQIVSIPGYFHPLDFVGSWNRLYGRRGFVQYQFLVPFGEERALERVVERIAASGAPSFLAVLKRFGAANPAPLSFPAPGWALALDLPAATRSLPELLHGLDALVLDAGGRHYLAKDAHTTPEAIRRGYARLDEWRAVRAGVDPSRTWASDQSQRLRLTGDDPAGATHAMSDERAQRAHRSSPR
ncbi:MAG: FAD-binding oxidoreductase, partial [Actinomycetota bacterium]|nr:FAD-binding oxidoreductase [Actinomycetota bacterium]